MKRVLGLHRRANVDISHVQSISNIGNNEMDGQNEGMFTEDNEDDINTYRDSVARMPGNDDEISSGESYVSSIDGMKALNIIDKIFNGLNTKKQAR